MPFPSCFLHEPGALDGPGRATALYNLTGRYMLRLFTFFFFTWRYRLEIRKVTGIDEGQRQMAGIPKDLLWEGDTTRIYFWAHPFFWYLVDRSRLEESGRRN